MEGSTNRCTKVQWRKGSCKDHFWKRSKFFVKSRIMASSCHNLNIQIGLQRNRLGGEEVVSKANLQIMDTENKKNDSGWFDQSIYVDSLPATVSHLLALDCHLVLPKNCVCMFARWCPIVQLFNWHLAPINSRFSFTNWEETQTYLPEFTTYLIIVPFLYRKRCDNYSRYNTTILASGPIWTISPCWRALINIVE